MESGAIRTSCCCQGRGGFHGSNGFMIPCGFNGLFCIFEVFVSVLYVF